MHIYLKIILPIFLIHSQLIAQRPGELKGFYGSFNLGLGNVTGNIDDEEIYSSTHFAMHLNAGVFICRSMQAGFTINGWLFETYGEIPFGYKGEGLSNGMLHLQIYPIKNKRLFFKGAYGISEYENIRPEGNHGNGNAFMLALGYEKAIGKGEFLWGVQFSYNNGKLKYNEIPGENILENREFHTIDLTVFLALD
jgi:hypothetical protein